MLWYVARTKPLKEREAAVALEQRGVEVYLPILRKRKPRAGRRDWEPLFACYLFARLEVPSEHWLAARSAPGIVYFLGHQGVPSAVPDDFIATLRARVEQDNWAGGVSRFQPGERVYIADGPFKYLEAIFEGQLSPSGRARVLVQMLRRLVPLELSEEHLRRAG